MSSCDKVESGERSLHPSVREIEITDCLVYQEIARDLFSLLAEALLRDKVNQVKKGALCRAKERAQKKRVFLSGIA